VKQQLKALIRERMNVTSKKYHLRQKELVNRGLKELKEKGEQGFERVEL
jgi:hypothetical protein